MKPLVVCQNAMRNILRILYITEIASRTINALKFSKMKVIKCKPKHKSFIFLATPSQEFLAGSGVSEKLRTQSLKINKKKQKS